MKEEQVFIAIATRSENRSENKERDEMLMSRASPCLDHRGGTIGEKPTASITVQSLGEEEEERHLLHTKTENQKSRAHTKGCYGYDTEIEFLHLNKLLSFL